MLEASLNIGVLQLAITSLSVLTSHSTHRQSQSGSIRFKNFQISQSFELAGRNVWFELIIFIIFPFMRDDIAKTKILIKC